MTPLERLVEAVNTLTEPRVHREPFSRRVGGTWVHERHVTQVAPLIMQLANAIEPSGSTQAGHRVPGSQPSASLAAIDALMGIETELEQIRQLFDLPERATLVATLRSLVGLATELGEPDQRSLARSAGRWVVIASVITGWEVPARRLDNTCPICGVRGCLLVRVDVDTADGRAFCTGCRESWDAETIGLLAAHIRAENNDELEASA